MGFFKKIFKPVSKVLDKIIPNEIKPALPYMAAFAPFIAPGIMGTSVMQRALMGGGLNILGQLSQEGNEGDINAISAGLGALTSAMTAPGSGAAGGASVTADGFNAGTVAGQPSASQFFKGISDNAQGQTGILASGKRFLGDTLAKGSDIMATGIEKGLLSKEGLKAATLPAATATGDLMLAEGKRAEDAYKDALAAYEAEMGDGATDVGRALAIRTAMEAYGFLDDEIEDTIAAAGYRAGGRVGFGSGGFSFSKRIKDEYNANVKEGYDGSIEDYIIEFYGEEYLDPTYAKGGRVGFDSGGNYITKKPTNWITKKKKFDLSDLESLQDDDDDDEEDNEGIKWITKKDSSGSNKWIQKKADGGRIGLRFGGIDSAVENIENQDVKESMKFASATSNMNIPMMEIVEQFELKFKRKPNSLDELKQFYKDKYGSQNIQEKLTETVRTTAAEGGLMNLGGKEMDMRTGGFIPIGKKERADDVPARLSKNEFVMTADAVRAAGGGSVNKGAKRMYEVMNKLEARA